MFLDTLIQKYSVATPDAPQPLHSGGPLPMDEAVLIIQKNERGRLARERMALKLVDKRQRQLEDKRTKTGVALSQEDAVVKIQSSLRGMIWRKSIREEADKVCHACTCLHWRALTVPAAVHLPREREAHPAPGLLLGNWHARGFLTRPGSWCLLCCSHIRRERAQARRVSP